MGEQDNMGNEIIGSPVPYAPGPGTAVSISRNVPLPEPVLEDNRIVARLSRNANADLFRILRTKVRQLMSQNNFRSLAITSPNYGDGKSTISINLALSLSMDVKQTVCLVDLDLRKPNVDTYLGLQTAVGLGDYLLHDTPLSQCLMRVTDRLVILPTGASLENSSETIGTPRMAHLSNELKARYPDRIIIYDMPPLLENQDDTLAFLPNIDAVLVVVKEGVTQASDLRTCLHALSDYNVIGTVLNHSLESGHGR